MPNVKIDPSLHQALSNAFGGSQPSPVQQPSAVTPPSPEGSGVMSSLFHALISPPSRNAEAAPTPINPYENFAKKAVSGTVK